MINLSLAGDDPAGKHLWENSEKGKSFLSDRFIRFLVERFSRMTNFSHPLDLFEAAWSEGNVPDVVHYAKFLLKADEESLLSELCQIDLERRWRSSDASVRRWHAQDYQSLSEVHLCESQTIDLIRWEFHVRNRWGDFPRAEALLTAWPQYVTALEIVLREASQQLTRPSVSFSGEFSSFGPMRLEGVLEVGRQRPGELPPFAAIPTADGTRLIVAPMTDASISRQQLSIRQKSEDTVEIANPSRSRAIAVARQGAIDAGESMICRMPVNVHLKASTFLCIDR